MTPERFIAKLKKLGYTPHNAHELLGIGRRSAFRYAEGETVIPEVVIKLIDMYERHGVPGEGRK
jgi:hypothetical protein